MPNSCLQVCLIDDEAIIRESTSQWLQMEGFEVTPFSHAETALAHLVEPFSGVVVSDVRMPGIDGLTLLKQLQQQQPDLPVILFTGHGDIDMATQAMREGAYDFIEKPFNPERLVTTIRRACEKRALTMENLRLQANLAASSGIESRLLGISQPIEQLRQQLLSLAPLDTSVIIYGETGTGKELVSQCLHDFSERKKHHFVPINCGAIPEHLIESELFGHEAGAFTGALKKRIGKFEYANGGTLLLDEIESMPPPLQIRLLRTLQEGVIERLGANQPIPVNLRVIAASKSDLREDPDFRDDLFYRLNVSQLQIPPLRSRPEDIPLLFDFYQRQAATQHQRDPRPPSSHDLNTLQTYQWPGNVRELKNIAVRYAIDPSSRITDLLSQQQTPLFTPQPRQTQLPLAVQVAEFEAQQISACLEKHSGNIKTVMEELDLPRRTLNQKMVRYGLNREDFLKGE